MSRINTFKIGALSIACFGFAVPVTAFAAGTQNSNVAVTAAVESACTISTTPLTFPAFTGSTAVATTATLSVTCTNAAPYVLALSAGTGASATTAKRLLTSATTKSTLNYGLYSDLAHTTAWGNTTGTDTVAGTGDGAAQNVTVYGQIAANQLNAQVATDYTDTVAVTVTY
ncbi:spore coat U domain-containing protein [Ewingella sp. S1.OA.A_B6]